MTSKKSYRYIPFVLLVLFLLLSVSSDAQRARRNRNKPVAGDTTKVDNTIIIDSLSGDTILLDTIGKKKKQPLDAPVDYEAKDSLVFTQGGFATLYGDGKLNYEKIELTSAVITMNMDSSTVYARGVTDSTGVETGTPIFKEGETPYESKIMCYNFKSKKGFINGIVTQQGEGYVTSENAKMPKYAHLGDGAVDLYSPADYVIKPGETIIIPCDIKVALPYGYAFLIHPRSGTSAKTKLRVANSVGLVDS